MQHFESVVLNVDVVLENVTVLAVVELAVQSHSMSTGIDAG